MPHVTDKFRAGKNVDPGLVRTVELLFSDQAARFALDILTDRDRLAGAITGDRNTDLWRVWRNARRLIAQEHPLDAFKQLMAIGKLHPLAQGNRGLAELEGLALISEGLASGYQPAEAIRTCERVRQRLMDFINRMYDDSQAVEDVRAMFLHLVGIRALREGIDNYDLLGAWALGRGLTLLLDVFQRVTKVLTSIDKYEEAKVIADAALEEITEFHAVVGYAFDTSHCIAVEMGLANCWTDVDPARALLHFDSVVQFEGLKTRHGLNAANNAANCLLRLHRYNEARARYADLEGRFELLGDYLAAARIRMAEYLSAWLYNGDPSIRDSLIGAIKLFEENLPASADINTLYTLKRYIEPAYSLLVTVASDINDRSEQRLDELLGTIWALLSRDFKSDLEPGVPEPGWPALLAAQLRPLVRAKTVLQPFPGTGVVHVLSTTDRIESSDKIDLPPTSEVRRLVWMVFGYDASGQFQFEFSTLRHEQAVNLLRFLDAMDQQLSADLLGDSGQVRRWELELVRISEQITDYLGERFVDVLRSMNHLYYLPQPIDLEEFPLAGLRLDGNWLGMRCSITRSPTINHLLEMLNPNRHHPHPSRRAVITVGEPVIGDKHLRDFRQEANRVRHELETCGFECDSKLETRVEDIRAWLDGEAAVIHYIGHGFSNKAYEGLPLSSGQMLKAVDIDSLSGPSIPFIFLCACEAGRIREGSGGYQIGLASKLAERGAPGVLAFSMPIPERRAYSVTRAFYPQAYQYPFGEAVQRSCKQLEQEIPTYAWLALTAYGEPEFKLPQMAEEQVAIPTLCQASPWHAKLRCYAALRTQLSRDDIYNAVPSAMSTTGVLLREFLDYAFQVPPASTEKQLNRLEAEALKLGETFRPESLSIRVAVSLERAHRAGLDADPIVWPNSPDELRYLLSELHYAAVTGGAFFDMRLNGLACALMGRLITWDQRNLKHSATFFDQAIGQLAEGAALSPYLCRIREVTISIVKQFGGHISIKLPRI